MRAFFFSLSMLFSTFVPSAFAHADTATALQFENGKIQAKLVWEKGPLNGEESILRVEFTDAATNAALDIQAKLGVVLFMPSMGHGSAPTSIEFLQTGIYRVSSIYFFMGGVWEMNFNLTHANGSVETQVLTLEIPGGMGHHH